MPNFIKQLLNGFADLVETLKKHRVWAAIGAAVVFIYTILGIVSNCSTIFKQPSSPVPAPTTTSPTATPTTTPSTPTATATSPTATPTTPISTSTPTGTFPPATIAPVMPVVRADIIGSLALAHDTKNGIYEFSFDLRLRNTGNASEQITRCTAHIDVPEVPSRKYMVSDYDFSFWQQNTKVSEIPVIQKDSSEIVTCKITLSDTPEFSAMFAHSSKSRELFVLLFGEENRSYQANFSFEITEVVRQTLLDPKSKSSVSFLPLDQKTQ